VRRVVFCADDPIIRKLGQIHPDVVFSDVAMPEIVFMTASVQRDQLGARVAQSSKN
jgi:hypothetical protein